RKKQDARLASYGAYCKVVLWPFRTRECLNESAFAFFMHTAAFAGFQEFALNQQYLWRWGCLRIVLRHSQTQSCAQNRHPGNKTSSNPGHRCGLLLAKRAEIHRSAAAHTDAIKVSFTGNAPAPIPEQAEPTINVPLSQVVTLRLNHQHLNHNK